MADREIPTVVLQNPAEAASFSFVVALGNAVRNKSITPEVAQAVVDDAEKNYKALISSIIKTFDEHDEEDGEAVRLIGIVQNDPNHPGSSAAFTSIGDKERLN